jgi:hypothetical protein
VGDEYSASPVHLTVLAFAPFVVIPDPIFRVLAVAARRIAAAWIVRHVGLPYWLAFPPLVAGVMVANPGVICIALALTGLGGDFAAREVLHGPAAAG